MHCTDIQNQCNKTEKSLVLFFYLNSVQSQSLQLARIVRLLYGFVVGSGSTIFKWCAASECPQSLQFFPRVLSPMNFLKKPAM